MAQNGQTSDIVDHEVEEAIQADPGALLELGYFDTFVECHYRLYPHLAYLRSVVRLNNLKIPRDVHARWVQYVSE